MLEEKIRMAGPLEKRVERRERTQQVVCYRDEDDTRELEMKEKKEN